jgi:hypothetical protein
MHLRVALTSTARSTRGRCAFRASSSWLRTARSDLAASRVASVAATQIRSYATPAKAPVKDVSQEEEDSARVWRSIEDLDEDYDPNWDTEFPENEFEGTNRPSIYTFHSKFSVTFRLNAAELVGI